MRALAVLAFVLGSVSTAAAAIAPDPRAAEATGTLRVLVIRATWGPTPGAPDDGRLALDEASAFYGRASFGALKLRLELTPWLLAYPAPTCPSEQTDRSRFGRLGELAQDAARAAGYEPSAYGRLVYVLPDRVCGLAGLGVWREVLLSAADSLEDGSGLVHELGHTFGLPHATSRLCFGCARIEYGDPFSPMGQGADDFSALEKLTLGWISRVDRVTVPGTYAVTAVDEPSSGAQALAFDAAEGEYWVEYRVHEPHLLARIVEPNDPRHPVYLRSVFRGGGETRFELRGVFRVSVASPGDRETQLTFAWTDRTPPTTPTLRVSSSRSPIARWGASFDTGSGLAGYRVVVDGRTVERTTSRRAPLGRLAPGRHRIAVVAVDRAGNRARAKSIVRIS